MIQIRKPKSPWVIVLVAVGSGHTMMRGSVVMKTTDTDKRQFLGRGVVAQVFDDHYSLVRFPIGLAFEEGDTIDRAP